MIAGNKVCGLIDKFFENAAYNTQPETRLLAQNTSTRS
jgi:hypothetical protein